MIAHRLSTVKDCDIIIVLKHGIIVEQGSHVQLLEMVEGHYRKLWERQTQMIEREEQEKEIIQLEK